MKNNKLIKELLPIIVLLAFIAVVLILCVISAGKKKTQGEDSVASGVEINAETMEPHLAQAGGASDKQTDEVSAASDETTEAIPEEDAPMTEVHETIELEEVVPQEMISDGGAQVLEAEEAARQEKEKLAEAKISAGTVSGNTTAVVVVKKTNVEMLAEMMDYWSKNNIEAVEDLSGLAHYRAMSAALKSPSHYYYYGERNADGQPEGKGIAVYGSDQYYYGDWKNGMREGDGMWVRMYYPDSFTVEGVNTVFNIAEKRSDTKAKATGFSVKPDAVLVSHFYRGGWAQDLPNGEGHEQFDVEIENAKEGTRYFQNVMGNFQNGLYHGSMYLITIEANGEVREWNGKASEGVFEDFGTRDDAGRVPICQNKQNPDSHLWIQPLENKDLGLAELRAQVRNRTVGYMAK